MVEGVETVNVVQNRVPKDTESANQIVDLPVSELPGTTENDRYLQDSGSIKIIHFGERARIVGNSDINFLSVGNMVMGTTPHHTHKKSVTLV